MSEPGFVLSAPVSVNVTVAGIADQISIRVRLVRIRYPGTIIANISEAISVTIPLVCVGHFRAIVSVIQDSVIVDICRKKAEK